MLPIDPKRIAANLTTLGDRGRAASAAALEAWAAKPYLPCERCAGKGCFVENRLGERRPFDPKDFRSANGDRFVASCPACRGLGRVPCSAEELEAKQAADAELCAAQYRIIRANVRRERGMTGREFDAAARRRLQGEPTPKAWLTAALELREALGGEQ